MNQNHLTMSMKIPVSYVSDDFSFYRVFCLYIFCPWTNQIRLTTSLTNLGLTLDLLVRTLFTIVLRVEESIVGVLASEVFSPTGVDSVEGIFASAVFIPIGVDSKGGQLLEIFWRSNS